MTEANPPAPPAPPPRVEPRFDPAGEYAVLMRDRARESEGALATEKAARADLERRLAEADTARTAAVQAAEKAGNERLMRAELRVLAKEAGIVDADVLRLIDLDASGVKLTKDGDVTGAAEAVAALKTAKPWAFAQTAAQQGNSSSSASPPPTPPAGGKMARDMTDAEYKAARAALTARR